MSEYYAVQRTGESLAHYGVKGMRWGVKKAREANSDKSMSKQFKKASRKLEKLERHGEGKKYAKRAAKLAAGGAALGAAGALGSIKNIDKVASAAARLSSKLSNTPKGKGLHRAVPTVGSKAAGAASNAIRNYEKWGSEKLAGNVTRHGAIRLGSMAAGAGMLGAAGYNAVRAARAKRNRQKAAEFRSEMQKAFKGTQYEGQVAKAGYHPKKKSRKYFTKQDFKDSAKTALLGGAVMGNSAVNYSVSKKAANSGSNTNRHGKRRSSSRNG